MNKSLKILVLGSTGMLGHQVVTYLKSFDNISVIDISRKNRFSPETLIVNIMESNILESKILQIKPDYIINCIGILVDGSKNTALATYINAYFPHYLKEICNKIDSKLVHISTDCVFSGESGEYKEDDFRDGKGIYAQTKILGEIIDDTNLTLRTSIIGPELKENGEGLFDWFVKQESDIKGYINSIWSGITTLELAKAIKWSIDNDITGVYHVTNNCSISKYEMLKFFKKYTNKEIEIKPYTNKRVDKSFLDSRKLINYEIPSYERMIEQMILSIEISDLKYPEHYQFIQAKRF